MMNKEAFIWNINKDIGEWLSDIGPDKVEYDDKIYEFLYDTHLNRYEVRNEDYELLAYADSVKDFSEIGAAVWDGVLRLEEEEWR